MNRNDFTQNAQLYKQVSQSELSIDDLVDIELEARAIFAEKQAQKWHSTAMHIAFKERGLESFAEAINQKETWLRDAKEYRNLKLLAQEV